MAARRESGIQSTRRSITTYGKKAKRPTNTAFAKTFAPTSRTEDARDGGDSTATRRPRATTTANHLNSSSPEPLSLDRVLEEQTVTSAQRKRKLSQVYSSADRGGDPLQSSEESSPSAPSKRRSRASSPEISRVHKERHHVAKRPFRSDSPDDLEAVEAKLSSPPPTPRPPKNRGAQTKIAPKKTSSFSPRASQNMDHLPVRVRSAGEFSPKSRSSNVSSSNSNGTADANAKRRAKPRLIDRLRSQPEDTSGKAAEKGRDSQASSTEPLPSSQTSDVTAMDSQTTSSQTTSIPQTPQRAKSRTFVRTASTLKRTYGQSNVTVREEEDLLESLMMAEEPESSSHGRHLELGISHKPNKPEFDFEDDEIGEGTPKGAKIRNIYELRQAGANDRAAEDMRDLADQMMSSNLSIRRAALVQVAEKIREKDFRRQVREYGLESEIFRGVKKETDTVSAYLIMTILVFILTSSPSSPLLRILRAEEIGTLFSRLLGIDQDVKVLARDRKSNLSKRNQTRLLAIQAALLELSIWEPTRPTELSPRSLTLECLHLVTSKYAGVVEDPTLLPGAVIELLFAVVSRAGDTKFWNSPRATETHAVCCALLVLVPKAMGSTDDGGEVSAPHLPIIADTLGAVLRSSAGANDKLKTLLLSLVLNVTNDNTKAPEVFIAKGLIPELMSAICNLFARFSNTISTEQSPEDIVNALNLRLCILIHLAKCSEEVRQIVFELPGDGPSSVNQLIRLFLGHAKMSAEADSDAKALVNVAFGYLAVLLGYLALYAPVREVFRSNHPAKTLVPLLDSIREFIIISNKMTGSTGRSEVDRNYSDVLVELQGLVRQLEDEAAYD